MAVCSIVNTITPGFCGRPYAHSRPDAILHEAFRRVNSASGCPRYRGVIV